MDPSSWELDCSQSTNGICPSIVMNKALLFLFLYFVFPRPSNHQDDTSQSIAKLKEVVQDQKMWSHLTQTIAKSWTQMNRLHQNQIIHLP